MNKRLIKTTAENGLKETLRQMKLLELKAIENKEFINFVFVNFAQFFTDQYKLLFAIHEFCLRTFKFKKDDHDETLIAPYLFIKYKLGDCDDYSLFIRAVLSVLGLQSNYILFAKEPDAFTHIAVLCSGVIVDGTNKNFNQYPSNYRYQKIL